MQAQPLRFLALLVLTFAAATFLVARTQETPFSQLFPLSVDGAGSVHDENYDRGQAIVRVLDSCSAAWISRRSYSGVADGKA
jgi:hypothetical protein